MKPFLDDDFLLHTGTARKLYHEYAAIMPVIDYHCHLNPKDIADDRKFKTLTEAWLEGDHYKWRAMRANGIPEKFCTGDADDYEKFEKWAETVPFTLRNPLYHWTHLELKRYFNLSSLLNPETSKEIYNSAGEMLQTKKYSCKNLLRKMNVEVVCTSDDPLDSLDHHRKIKKDGFEIKIVPTFRPDKSIAVENAESYNKYISQLEKVTDHTIVNFHDLIYALQKRHDFFHNAGCRLSDHGIETFYAEDYSANEILNIFEKIRRGNDLTTGEILKFKSAMLIEFAVMNHTRGWAQQFHYGALRNTNTRMMEKLGPDTGFDSIGDTLVARSLNRFLDRLASQGKLTKTILYNLNPADNEILATTTGNFQDGSVPGKIQFGSGWWFLDQKDGMEKQLNALSNMGLLSRFVGMLTDSRSFLSYPRHEYFRRVLCNLIGTDVENGELPREMDLLGKMIQNICYFNAKNYFNLNP
ncbi:MAG: glucuronate isomerase [Bacteroidales bacterium]|nr:MAG: glucuronate isomerase [Bacteroidales bacterium]